MDDSTSEEAGDEVIVKVQYREGAESVSNYSDLPDALATFDPVEGQIRVESTKSNYIGLHSLKIIYTM